MEGSPLTLAYTHARNAAQETKRANHVAASEEHDLAAAEFAAAAQQTTDEEALRVLKLLEQHHKQLGHILKNTHLKPDIATEEKRSEFNSTGVPSTVVEELSTKSNDANLTNQPPRLVRTARSTARDLSSSIASNLASARGIPGAKPKRTVAASPLVSNDNADGTFSQNPEQRRDTLNESQPPLPSWTPPSDVGVRQSSKPFADTSVSDAPFQQFYSTFEGFISKLSAPLAFAGLPLTPQGSAKNNPEEKKGLSSPEHSTRVPSKSDPSPPTVTPDYSQLISQAALRAVRETNEPSYSKLHESFLLVPTSGGTMSYADITAQTHINRQLQQHSHNRNASGASDDFVDASSQILPAKSDRRANQMQKYAGKTMEELHLENQVLRKTTNEITKRLQAFESAAQTSSAALAQSIRSLHLSPVTTPQNSRGKNVAGFADIGGINSGDVQMEARIRDLEMLLQKSQRKVGKRDDELTKYKLQVEKYERKWQDLKAGAKARREAANNNNNVGAGNGGTADRARRSSKDSKPSEGGQGEGSLKGNES